MGFGELVQAAFNGITGTAIYGVAILGLLELATGILRAISSAQFTFSLIDVWVRTQLAGRILPIVLVLIAGAAAPDLSVLGLTINILTVTGLAAAAVYAATALTSILGNVNPQTADTLPAE